MKLEPAGGWQEKAANGVRDALQGYWAAAWGKGDGRELVRGPMQPTLPQTWHLSALHPTQYPVMSVPQLGLSVKSFGQLLSTEEQSQMLN